MAADCDPDPPPFLLVFTFDLSPVDVNWYQMGGVNRRMVGHGNLAERAVLPVMPSTEAFPYTTRVFAEVISKPERGVRVTCRHVSQHLLPRKRVLCSSFHCTVLRVEE